MNDHSPPTDRQLAILDFVREAISARGLPPSLAEIAEAFGFRSRRAAQKHLQALQGKGLIELLPGKARGIVLPHREPARRRGRSSGMLDIPVLGRVAAGLPIGADAGLQRSLSLDPELFSPAPDYLLRVQGDSMRDDSILDGDLVAVKRAAEARNGQIVIARLDDEITIKRLQTHRRGIRLLPRNPDYPVIEVATDQDFAIEGIYCGLVRPAG